MLHRSSNEAHNALKHGIFVEYERIERISDDNSAHKVLSHK